MVAAMLLSKNPGFPSDSREVYGEEQLIWYVSPLKQTTIVE